MSMARKPQLRLAAPPPREAGRSWQWAAGQSGVAGTSSRSAGRSVIAGTPGRSTGRSINAGTPGRPRVPRPGRVTPAAAALALPCLLVACTAILGRAHASPALVAPPGHAAVASGREDDLPGAPALSERPADDAETGALNLDPGAEPGNEASAREQPAAEPGKLVRRGYLGVEILELTPELRAHFGAPENAGVMIARVVAGSPADRAGLKVGDILTALDGMPMTSSRDARGVVRPLDEGALLAIEVRRDGQPQVMTASVERRERRESEAAALPPSGAGASGVGVLPASPAPGATPAEGVSRAARPRLQPLKSPREELLEKKLKALEKRLNELESRIPKN
jgi:membrane-associated protease RseP (regulator of RpoE activity)